MAIFDSGVAGGRTSVVGVMMGPPPELLGMSMTDDSDGRMAIPFDLRCT